MSIHEEILEVAQKILGDSADVSIEGKDAAATKLAAVAKLTGYVEFKTVVHGLGYATEARSWAKSFLDKIAIPAAPSQKEGI
jgi:hypothetical protein